MSPEDLWAVQAVGRGVLLAWIIVLSAKSGWRSVLGYRVTGSSADAMIATAKITVAVLGVLFLWSPVSP